VSRRKARNLKKLCRALVAALVIAVALAGYNISFPPGSSAASNWTFAADHPTILLHMVVATGILALAVAALVVAIRGRNGMWVALTTAGLGFVLLAYGAGGDYVSSLHKSALSYMDIGWTGAVVMYGLGWYLGRKKERAGEFA
jgi:hypothetical protein